MARFASTLSNGRPLEVSHQVCSVTCGRPGSLQRCSLSTPLLGLLYSRLSQFSPLGARKKKKRETEREREKEGESGERDPWLPRVITPLRRNVELWRQKDRAGMSRAQTTAVPLDVNPAAQPPPRPSPSSVSQLTRSTEAAFPAPRHSAVPLLLEIFKRRGRLASSSSSSSPSFCSPSLPFTQPHADVSQPSD